jgi:hypothetical protein
MSAAIVEKVLVAFKRAGFPDEVLLTLSEDEIRLFYAEKGFKLTFEQNLLLMGKIRSMRKSKENDSNARSKKRVSNYIESSNLDCANIPALANSINQIRSEGRDLDICFCLDGTGSMSGIIKHIKETIVKISNTIAQKSGMSSKFALVVYRDYCDGPKRIEHWDFNTVENFERHLSTVVAQGGGDGPEDCFGGLYFASGENIHWQALTKLIVWIGDAPQHGRQFHNGLFDSYPEGDPDGITATKILDQLAIKNIRLVFGKIGAPTDTMIKLVKEEADQYEGHIFAEFSLSEHLADELAELIIKASSYSSPNNRSEKSPSKKTYIQKKVSWQFNVEDWGNQESCKIIILKPFFSRKVNPLIDLLADGPEIDEFPAIATVTRLPVDSGELRYAYKVMIRKNCDSELVHRICKESKFVNNEFNSCKAMINQAQIQLVAKFLAIEFNTLVKTKQIRAKEIEYLPVNVLHFCDRIANKFMCIEDFIEGYFFKFSNNVNFVDRELLVEHSLLQAFSHFTYQYSGKRVIVTDLQGFVQKGKYILTDPAIHTHDPEKVLPDRGNLGIKGVTGFFSVHQCNDYCRRLELQHPDAITLLENIPEPLNCSITTAETEY